MQCHLLNDYALEVRTYSHHLVEALSYRDPIHFQRYHLLFSFFFKLRSVGYLIRDLNCFHFLSYNFRLLIFASYFEDDRNKTPQVLTITNN